MTLPRSRPADGPAQRFRALLEEHKRLRPDLSDRALARMAGVSPNTISLWSKGAAVPRPSSVRLLARALGVPEAPLMAAAGYGPEMDGGPIVPNPEARIAQTDAGLREVVDLAFTAVRHRVALQDGFVHAGEGGEVIEWVYVPPTVGNRRAILVEVRGDCMAPEVPEGALVLFDLDESPTDGQVVVADVDGSPELRRLDVSRGVLRANDGTTIDLRRVRAAYPALGMWVPLGRRAPQ